MEARHHAALRIAATYAVVAMGWILLSDSFVALFPARAALVMQTGKGLAFVAVTTITLYVVVSRFADRIGLVTSQAASTERLLTQVVETVPVGVVMTNGDGEITFLNPSAEYLLGLSAVEAVGRTLDEICFYRDPTQAGSLGELLRTGAIDGLELGYRDGQPSRALIARAAMVDPDVPGSGWIVALADVTDSHHTSVRLQRLLLGYRFLTDAAIAMSKATSQQQLLESQTRIAVEKGGFVGAWATMRDPRSGNLIDLGVVGLGTAAAEIAMDLAARFDSSPTTFIDRMKDGDLYVNNDVGRDPTSPWTIAVEKEGFGSLAAMPFHAGGEVVATLTVFAPNPGFFDADEIAMLRTLRSAVAFALEKLALERRRLDAEEALARGEAAYRELFELHPLPIWVFDRETLAFLAVNAAALDKYGYSKAEFFGMTIADICPPEDVARTRVMISGLHDGQHDAGIWTHVDRDGRAFPVHIYPRPVEWEGRQAEIILAVEVATVH